MDLVLNEASKRKSDNMIGIYGKDRYFSGQAKSKQQRYPGNMFSLLNHVLGVPFSEATEIFKRFESLYIPTKFVENKGRDSINVVLGEGDVEYSVEELHSMIFSYVKGLVEAATGDKATHCVVSIPPFYTMEQRRGLIESAGIAGIKIQSLIHESKAIALQYGVQRLREVKNPTNIVFFDFGATCLTISVVRYRPHKQIDKLGHVNIRAISYDQSLGGKDFEAVLATYFARAFQKQHGTDVTKLPRVMTRLMIAATKTKEVLSANTETYASVESLHDDIDFKIKVTRSEFEAMSEHLTKRIVPLVQQVLEKSKIKIDKISAFELIGGGSRMPIVQNLLKAYLKRDLQYSLNADECIALGATFHAAELSPLFQVKKYEVSDLSPYDIKFSLSGNTAKHGLFSKEESMSSPKIVSVPREKDFDVSLLHNDREFMKTSLYDVEKAHAELTPNGTEFKRRSSLTYRMNNNGFISLESALATLEEGKDTKRALISSKVIENYKIPSLTEEEIKKAHAKIHEFEAYEAEKRHIAKARNDLESYIYKSKGFLESDSSMRPFMSEAEVSALSVELDPISSWIYQQEDSTPAINFETKYQSLLDLTKDFTSRSEEAKQRVREIDACKTMFGKTRDLLVTMEATLPHITKEERGSLEGILHEVEKWLDEKKRIQENLPLNETPAVHADEIKKNCRRIYDSSFNLLKKPVPPPIKEEKKEDTPTEPTGHKKEEL